MAVCGNLIIVGNQSGSSDLDEIDIFKVEYYIGIIIAHVILAIIVSRNLTRDTFYSNLSKTGEAEKKEKEFYFLNR